MQMLTQRLLTASSCPRQRIRAGEAVAVWCFNIRTFASTNKSRQVVDCQPKTSAVALSSPVLSYNEWDPLEEVIVGRPDGYCIPSLNPQVKAFVGPEKWEWYRKNGGKPYEPAEMQKAAEQVDEFCRVLQAEGVIVRRPEPTRWDKLGTFRTPYFEEGGMMNSCPRDPLLVVGNEIIETASAWRSRMFESYSYKKLFNEYFERGALWTAAPQPTMNDDLYDKDYPYEDAAARDEMAKLGKFVLTEAEPTFDGADAIRFGRDIFVALTNTTNRKGIEWLRRHLKSRDIRVHSFVYHRSGAQNFHSDVELIPLKPGLLMVNPNDLLVSVNDVPVSSSWDYFGQFGWTVFRGAHPVVVKPSGYSSHWLSLNVLLLDTERVVIQRGEEPLKRLLVAHGMKPIEVDMVHAYKLGGAFHCWTLDVRRRGCLQSYFN